MAAQVYHPDQDFAVVSITSPGQDPADFEPDTDRRGICRVEFDDTTYPDVNGWTIISPQQADKIVRFFTKYRETVDIMLVHCEAGISRSRGVGVALDRLLGNSVVPHFVHGSPNPIVVHEMFKALRRAGHLTSQKRTTQEMYYTDRLGRQSLIA